MAKTKTDEIQSNQSNDTTRTSKNVKRLLPMVSLRIFILINTGIL